MHSLLPAPALIAAPPAGAKETLLPLLSSKQARIGVIGLGYVGLPLAVEFARAGFDTTGFDVDAERIYAVNGSRSYLPGLTDSEIEKQRLKHRLHATADMRGLRECDCIVVCVPTPLNTTHEPDVSHILAATAAIQEHLRPGQLIVLESTTYPGTTDELLLPVLREFGCELERDFLLAFSPERIDPGNADFTTGNIPKIVGGCSVDSTEVAAAMYAHVVGQVHVVSSTRVAETAKLLENTFRAVNIGLINEMARLCHELKIDIWEVIEAAKTKPFGFMPFYPGPGVGGHCIPLDPQYLSWKGRQYGFESRLIDTAQEINAEMPDHVVTLIAEGLVGRPLAGAKVLVLGVAYKQNVNDARESPARDVIRLLREQKACVSYHDPFVPELRFDGAHDGQSGPALQSVPLDPRTLAESDCVVIITGHRGVDYPMVAEYAPLIVDTRNVLAAGLREHAAGEVVRL